MKLTVDEDKADSLFIYYLFSGPVIRERILRNDIGSTIPGFNLGQLKSFRIRIPPLVQQQAIAQMLSSLDDKIELNRRMNVTLESMARALFKSWFVDFDPVIDNALAAGNPIPEPLIQRAQTRRDLGTKRKPLPKNIQKLFPSSFVFDDDTGWVPEGWDAGSITGLAELNAESWTAKNHPDSVEYVDLGNAKEGEINEIETYAYSEAPSRAKRVLSKDDTIVGTVRPGNRSFAFVLSLIHISEPTRPY